MREAIHEYLLTRRSGAAADELLDLIFTQPASDPEFGPRFLVTLLGGDERFDLDEGRRRWHAAAHRHLAHSLDEATFVVVDLETTGGSPGRGESIIEIGAVKVAAGQIIDTFQSLVDPRRPLPPFITRLTGIDDSMLAGQSTIDQILPAFAGFAGDSVLVAHNASFDRSFLDAAWRHVLGRPLTRQFLCTLRLARRLLPQLRKRSLDALAAHYGIIGVDRHRALGDARITVEVLFHLLELLSRRGIVRLGEALDFQESANDGRRFFCMLPRSAVAALPRGPGVYRFTGENGELLYIGKAGDLQQRVSSYLSNSTGHSRKTLDLIRHIRAVDVEEAGSELEASLLEAELIRRHQPRYNVLRKHLPRIAYLKLAVSDRHPRLSLASRLSRGGARYFGPFRSRAHAQRALDTMTRVFRLRTCAGRLSPAADFPPCLQGQIGHCTRPCNGDVDDDSYAEQVAAFLRFLDEGRDDIFDDLARRRDTLSEQLRFEAAARVQADIDLARHLQARQLQMSWIVERQQFVVVQPSVDSGSRLVYVVVHGRLVERVRLEHTTDIQRLVECVTAHLGTKPSSKGIAPDEVDGTTILAAWLRDRDSSDGYVIPIDDAAAEAIADTTGGGCAETERLPDWAAALRALSAPTAHRDAIR